MSVEKDLEQYDLHIEYAEETDEPIDFEIRDYEDGLVATVWGSDPINDIQIDCEHYATEFDDDEHVGVCPICGATCTWYWNVSADDGYTVKEQVPDQWEYPEKIGGIVGEYLKELQKEF